MKDRHVQKAEATAHQTKFEPTTSKKESKPRDEPVYVKVNSQHRDDDPLHDGGKIVNTDVASENEVMEDDNQITQELPTIKTEINHEKIVPQFEDVKVKSKLDEKKVTKKIGGLIDLADSNGEYQTDIRK